MDTAGRNENIFGTFIKADVETAAKFFRGYLASIRKGNLSHSTKKSLYWDYSQIEVPYEYQNSEFQELDEHVYSQSKWLKLRRGQIETIAVSRVPAVAELTLVEMK